MASLFREISLGQSKREITMPAFGSFRCDSGFASATVSAALPSPFGGLTPTISSTELRETAYEIFVASCRNSTGKPLTYIPNNSTNSDRSPSPLPLPSPSSSSNSGSPSMQRSLTSAAASKVKKAFGIRSSSNSSLGMKKGEGSPSSGGKPKKPMTIGELMRVQMRVSEITDSRIRRGLLRIAAGQVIYLNWDN